TTPAVECAAAPPAAPAADPDLRALLDEELTRLPARYHAPAVLCWPEGRTHAEAARAPGWPKGTAAGRLARARDLARGPRARRAPPSHRRRLVAQPRLGHADASRARRRPRAA